jgi:hypothetical protein
MFCKVVEKKLPLWRLPKVRHFVIVEANHERGDEIESLAEIWERTESVDSLDYTSDAEEARNFAKHRQAIHIETDASVAEQLSDVKKISCAAAQIQNPPWSRQVEFNLANPADVNFDPTFKIEIFWPVRAGICNGVSLTNLPETNRINCFDDALCS